MKKCLCVCVVYYLKKFPCPFGEIDFSEVAVHKGSQAAMAVDWNADYFDLPKEG